MKNIDYNNLIQKEALLNECKGNLFEFLVTQNLAIHSQIESQFLFSLPSDFKNRLIEYEQIIRDNDLRLLVSLPELASKVAHFFFEKTTIDPLLFYQWNVLGKLVSSDHSGLWNETDVVGFYNDPFGKHQKVELSLKLVKENSFVNTKSAGVKSFISRYFSSYGQLSLDYQSLLNIEVEDSFFKMGHRLYQEIDKDFSGTFDQNWKSNYTELPGELPEDLSIIVFENYFSIAKKLHSFLQELYLLDQNLFMNSLASLCGFGNPDIIQLNCYHQAYEIRSIEIKRVFDLFPENGTQFKILPLKDRSSSIEIEVSHYLLQLRIKPMNKFTTAAYKINCSIKEKK